MHGDSPEYVAAKVADMRERRERFGLPPMHFGVAGYAIVRETEAAAQRELERITDVKQNASGFANYQQWLNGTQLEQRMSIEELFRFEPRLALGARRHSGEGSRSAG